MLKVENACITFHANTVNERKALDDVSLHLKPGDFATIIGSNGAGKSTLLNAVAGSYLLDSGYVYIDGEDVTMKKAISVRNTSAGCFKIRSRELPRA